MQSARTRTRQGLSAEGTWASGTAVLSTGASTRKQDFSWLPVSQDTFSRWTACLFPVSGKQILNYLLAAGETGCGRELTALTCTGYCPRNLLAEEVPRDIAPQPGPQTKQTDPATRGGLLPAGPTCHGICLCREASVLCRDLGLARNHALLSSLINFPIQG